MMVTVYSVLFHVLMVFEGREHSWITGFYWILTVMGQLPWRRRDHATKLSRLRLERDFNDFLD
jgi:hypothetical protein